MTNYEKIKSMSFKKMVKFLYYFDLPCEMCPCNDEYYQCMDTGTNYDCKKTLKAWLKAESEED